MLKRRTLLTSAAVISTYISTRPRANAATPRNVVVMGKQIDDVITLDPQESFEYTGAEIGSNVYQKLVIADPAAPSRLNGELAERWEISPDGKTYTFHIRPDAKFASGKPVTAEDAAFSIQRAVLLDKAPGFIITQFGLTKDNVAERVKAVDAHTLRIELPEAFAPTFLLYCLTSNVGSIVEKATVLANQKDGDLGGAWLKTNSAGSGPLALRSWLASESISLDLNRNFTGTKPAWNRCVVRHMPEPSAQLLALRQRDIDYARNLGPDQLRAIAGNAEFVTAPTKRASLIYIALNQKHPILSRPAVRQAIKWAINYEAIEKNITANIYHAHQAFLPAGLPGALTDMPFKKDVARAMALLAEAGVPDGFEISMDHFSGAPQGDIAQAIQADLMDIGIKVNLLGGEMRAIITKTRARTHEMAMLRWASDYLDPNSNAQAFCENTDNSDSAAIKPLTWRSSWQDKEISDMSLAAVRELDGDKRIAMYQQLQRLHRDRSPFVILLQEIEVPTSRRGVSGLYVGATSDSTQYSGIIKS